MRLKASFETELFINQGGYYAIKQDVFCERCGDEHSAVIQLTPKQMRAIMADMKENLKIAGDWFSEVENGALNSDHPFAEE